MIELTGHKGLVVALAYSPDGRTLASASADGTARLWDLATGKLTATLQSPAARAYCVAFSPGGQSIAVGYGGPQGVVQTYDLSPPPRQRDRWVAHTRVTRSLAFHPAGVILATAGDDWDVRLWTLDAGASANLGNVLTLEGVPGAAVAFDPTGRRLATVSLHPASVSVWQAEGGERYRTVRRFSPWGYSVAFDPTGELVAVGLERRLGLWRPTDYRQPLAWPAHLGAVLGVAFTPDGQTLLTGGDDGLVKLWDPDGRLRHTFDWKLGEIGAVAFAPDGLTAAAGGYETILVWDVGD